MTEYEEARDNFIGWLLRLDSEKAQRAMRAESMTRLGYLLRLAAKLKLPYVVEWCQQFLDQTGEKLVVFGVHHEVLGELRQSLKAKSVLIDGSVTGSRRQQLVDQFQQDSKTRLFLGNLRAAGVGLTLTAASTVAFAELSYRPADLLQAEDRVHRIGQVNPVAEYYLVAHGTIEEKLCRVLQKKLEVISSIIDGRPSRDFDVLRQVRRLLCSSPKS
jgi:SWI/SNF-related matrix-associated actin-dependent regulator 1 of chromatin subfamily A